MSFFTVHTAVVYVIQLCGVYGEKLLVMDRGTVLKQVEFYSENKIEKAIESRWFYYNNVSRGTVL